jgi:hypothetical protein
MTQARRLLPLMAGLIIGMFPWRNAMATEEPSYRIAERHRGWEIRVYEPRIEARTTVQARFENASSDGFRILASYIFGANEPAQKIDMTAPVSIRDGGTKGNAPTAVSAKGPGSWEVAFVMPSDRSMETLPAPKDPRVRLSPVPEQRVAALRFSGSSSAANVERRQRELLEALAAAGLETAGPPILARYDPPWIPTMLRRNEILIPLAEEG